MNKNERYAMESNMKCDVLELVLPGEARLQRIYARIKNIKLPREATSQIVLRQKHSLRIILIYLCFAQARQSWRS